MQRWIERWNAYWFPPTSTLNLAGARILAVAAQLFWFFPHLNYQISLATKNAHFIDPQPVIRAISAVIPRHVLFNATSLTILYWVTFVAGLAALVGLFTRTALVILAVGILIFVSHAYSYADVHHPEALFAFLLVSLPFSPAGDRLSIDARRRRRRVRQAGGADAPHRSDLAMWPLKFTHVLLSLTYFSTGITKLLSGGLRWMNGYTLQNDVLSDAVARGMPLGIWLAQQHTLCVLLSIGTIVFETFYFVSLLLPRTAPLWFLGGVFFHIGLYLTAGHPFFPHIVLNLMLLLFLDPAWFPARVAQVEAALIRWRAREQAQQAT